ncbi:hypothetical protein QL285_051517 [Trifolium repens]|nr:hypothetical protein QL285_051517 [Trifolium repens]
MNRKRNEAPAPVRPKVVRRSAAAHRTITNLGYIAVERFGLEGGDLKISQREVREKALEREATVAKVNCLGRTMRDGKYFPPRDVNEYSWTRIV